MASDYAFGWGRGAPDAAAAPADIRGGTVKRLTLFQPAPGAAGARGVTPAPESPCCLPNPANRLTNAG